MESSLAIRPDVQRQPLTLAKTTRQSNLAKRSAEARIGADRREQRVDPKADPVPNRAVLDARDRGEGKVGLWAPSMGLGALILGVEAMFATRAEQTLSGAGRFAARQALDADESAVVHSAPVDSAFHLPDNVN